MALNKEARDLMYLQGLFRRVHRLCKFKSVKGNFCRNSSESGMCSVCEYGLKK